MVAAGKAFERAADKGLIMSNRPGVKTFFILTLPRRAAHTLTAPCKLGARQRLACAGEP